MKTIGLISLLICFIESYFLPNNIGIQTSKEFLSIYLSLSSGLFAVFIACIILSCNILNIIISALKHNYERQDFVKAEEVLNSVKNIPVLDITIVGFGSLFTLLFSMILYEVIVLFNIEVHKIILFVPQFSFISLILILGRAIFNVMPKGEGS